MKKFERVAGDRVEFLDERFYYAGDDDKGEPIFYPSVTSILDMYPKGYFFNEWLKSVGFNAGQIADRAANAGTKVHAAVEDLVQGSAPEWLDGSYTEEEWRGIMGFTDFCTRFKPRFIGSEIRVLSHKYRYAGTLDLVGYMDGKLWMWDVKFSNEIHDTAWLQLAAYKQAWEEKHPDLQIEEMGVLHLKAKTRTEGSKGAIQGKGWKCETPSDPAKKLFDIFLKVHGIYYYQNPNPQPKNYSLPTKLSLPKECLIVNDK